MSEIVPFRRRGNYSSLASSMVRRMFGRPLNAQQARDALRLGRNVRRGRRAAGRTRTLRKRNVKSSAGVLGGTNADMRSIYRRKRMPYRKKKRWVKFVKQVHAVSEKELGLRTVLFNDQIDQVNSTETQSTLTLCLYPVRSGTGWLNDLKQIGELENDGGNPTAQAGGYLNGNTKIMFQSAVMDITIRNTSQKLVNKDPGNPLLDVWDLAPEAAIELDIYEVYIRKTASNNVLNFDTVTTMLNQYDDPEIGGTGTGISIADRGATPFEFGTQMGRTGIKILKKTKFFIPNGQTITWQTRDPSRHTTHYGELTRTESFNMVGWTKTYFLVYKLVPGLASGTNEGQYRKKLSIGFTRKYSYKIEGFNEPRERLLGQSYTAGGAS